MNNVNIKLIIPREYKIYCKINTEDIKETVLNIYEELLKYTLDKIFLVNWNVTDMNNYFNLKGFITKSIRLAEKELNINIRNNNIVWDIQEESYIRTENIIKKAFYEMIHNSYDDLVIKFA